MKVHFQGENERIRAVAASPLPGSRRVITAVQQLGCRHRPGNSESGKSGSFRFVRKAAIWEGRGGVLLRAAWSRAWAARSGAGGARCGVWVVWQSRENATSDPRLGWRDRGRGSDVGWDLASP